jgi:hypothetical protein
MPNGHQLSMQNGRKIFQMVINMPTYFQFQGRLKFTQRNFCYKNKTSGNPALQS